MKLLRVPCFLSLAALAVAGPLAHSQANVVENQTTVVYVDAQSGSDSNSGAASSPLKTIQAAVNKANINNQKSIGTRIIVDAGIYRETVNVDPVTGMTSAPLTIQAAANGTAVIAASDILTGWSADPQYSSAYVANWTPAQSTCALPSGWPAVQEIALHTEMLFVNGIAMTQVLNYSDLKPGTFFVNTSDGTVHVWPPAGADPSAATIEVASRAKTISIVGRSNVVLRGLAFEHAANCINTSSATVTSSSNVLIDSIQANWNSWGGLSISASSNITVQNSRASYNGGVGFQGTKDQAALYTGDEADYNNWRGAQATLYNWASAGAKFFQMRTTSVQGFSSYNNQAQGLWFDTDNQNITINNATLVGSYEAALQLERSEGPITLENSHLCSSGVGVNVLTTEGLTVNNNVFYNNGATNKYEAQFYLAGSAGGISITNWQTGEVYDLFTTGTTMSGNAFIDGLPGQYVFGTYLSGTDWSDFTSTLKSNDNTWYDPSTASAFRIVNGKNVNLAGWQTATGADYNSSWGAPTASPAAACTAPASSYPDFNVSVDNSAYTMTSGLATATVRVNSFQFGTVNLSVSRLPSGVTASFSNANLTSGYSTLTLTASATATAQTVPVTLWAVSNDRVHSATFNLTVTANPAAIGTTTSLYSSASTITEGAPITLSATVKSASGSSTPTGSVTFYDGATSLGSASLSSGTATLMTSALQAGSNALSAVYAGSGNFLASTSTAIAVTANPAAAGTITTLSASTTSIAQNSSVVFTAVVKPSSGTGVPAGTVTFYNGSASLGSATLSSGTAKISTSALPVGTDSITAAYSGTTGFNASTSGAVSVNVNPVVVSTSVTLASSASSVEQKVPVTLTATVKPSSGTTLPSGTVTFYNGTIVLGSATLSSGIASVSTSALPTGTDPVSAAYSGAVAFNASSSNIVSITVSPAAPTVVNTVTTLTSSATSITQNSSLTLVATVKQASGTATPTGSVTFYNGSTVIGSAQLSAGTATLTTASLTTGTDTLTAAYAGASTFNPSHSGGIIVTVSPNVIQTSTTLTTSSAGIAGNSTITLMATVKQASGTTTPTGSVTFSDGSVAIGTVALSAGSAALTTSSLPVGINSITASYTGASLFNASRSNAVAITVSPVIVDTTVTLEASATTLQQNSPLTLVAAVKASTETMQPIGTVTFFDGSQSIGTASIASGKASISTTTLPVGHQSLTASYAGTANLHQSTSNILDITINAAAARTTIATRTAITSSTPQADQGFTICLTATVAPTSGSTSPTGNVDFMIGKNKIGTAALANGSAYLTTAALPPGDNAITASYEGDGSFASSSSSAITVNILGPDFTVAATPSSISATPGQSVDVALLITPKNGFDQFPAFACNGLPAGSTCSFGAPSKQSDGTSTVQMTIHTVSLAAQSGSAVRSRAPIALAFFPILFWMSSRRRRQSLRLFSMAALFLAVAILGAGSIGCGGRSSLNSGQATAASTTVNIVVSAQSTNGINHATTVTLTLE